MANKAILINPTEKTVSLVTVGDFRDMQAKIGCSCFTTAGVQDNNDTLYVDDEGLLNGTDVFFFNPDLYPQPLAGNGLLIGSNFEGESVDVKTDVAKIAENTQFLTRQQLMALYS